MSVYRIFLLTLTGIGAVGCIVFCIKYWLVTNGHWKYNEAGRFMMLRNANLGALFLVVIANQLFGQWPGRDIITIVLFGIFCVLAWWPLRLLSTTNEDRNLDD